MNDPSYHPSDELLQRFWSVCDGNASDAELAELEAMASADPAIRRCYVKFVAMHIELPWTARGDEASLVAAAVANLPRPPRPYVPPASRWRPSALLATCAASLLFYGSFAIVAWNMRPDASPRASFPVAQAPDQQAPPDFSSSVAKVGTVTDVKWSKGMASKTTDASIHVGESLKIDSGMVELELKAGTKLVIQGPADWSVEGGNSISLRAGTLLARVPKHAIGFTVETPTATIVDLGTEFTAAVDEEGRASVVVHRGSVEVTSRDESDLFVGDRQVSRKRTLVAGESAQVMSRRDNLRAKNVKALPETPATLPDDLVAYWNFDEDRNIVWDQRDKSHGELAGVDRVPGLIGRGAVNFSNLVGQQVRIVQGAGEWGLEDGLTVEATFVSNWSGKPLDYDEIFRKENSGMTITLSFQNDDKDDVNGPVLGFELTFAGINGRQSLDLLLDGIDGRPSFDELTDGKVHHVAATYDSNSGTMAIHVDGAKRTSRIIQAGAKLANIGDVPAAIGNWAYELKEPFNGVLDEVAVYRRALSDEEITRHWQNVRAGASYFLELSDR